MLAIRMCARKIFDLFLVSLNLQRMEHGQNPTCQNPATYMGPTCRNQGTGMCFTRCSSHCHIVFTIVLCFIVATPLIGLYEYASTPYIDSRRQFEECVMSSVWKPE